MQTSIFIARLIGPVLAIMGLVVLVNPERVRQMGPRIPSGWALIFLSGVITLPLGLAIVNTHNVWEVGWPVIITIFGWLAVFAGIARMALPGAMKSIRGVMLDKAKFLATPGALMLALGGYLSYQGYLA